ncbi:hypothetical protein R84B8_02272 [Treponema sp. R8-4-B8]
MKKIFTVLAIFALVLAGCDDGNTDENNNSDVIGKWTGNNNGEEITLDIAQDTWVMIIQSAEGGIQSVNGTWYREGNNLTLYSNYGSNGSASLSGDTLILNRAGLTVQLKKNNSSTGNPSTGGTSLKIQNDSFSEITDVRWNNVSFTQGTESIRSGANITKAVQEGKGYIYFKRKTNPINARTKEWVVVDQNQQKPFTINDYTIIVDVDNPANEGTFGTLGVNREPQITVQAGDAPIAQFGDYDFGSVLVNNNKDVTFTIGNSGKADLRFNVVEGNVINLSNNASEHFSVTQQPFASMTIAPGSTTTFIISFSPKTAGNNLNAQVMIKTNSDNNAEFTFRVKGNGGNEYQIGDTGPGGGKIFFAQGGQYKECSGELGAYNWTDAVSTATNYRGGNFTNWRLPDRGELDLLYQSRTTIGGFSNAGYWSSTAYNSLDAWVQNFGTSSLTHYYNGTSYTISPGGQDWVYKSNSYRVRAVRSFTQ